MSAYDKLQEIRCSLACEIRVYRLVLAHPRCPRRAKVLLGFAVAYLALPFDLIPEFIPGIGHLDDAIVVPGLVWLALRSIPKDVMEDCRRQAREALKAVWERSWCRACPTTYSRSCGSST